MNRAERWASAHYRLRCEVCQKIVAQCRCQDLDKAERLVVCADCLTKAAEQARELAT